MDAALRSDDVAIDQLRVRGSSVEQQRMQQTLTSLSWPHAQGDEWIFIRQLSVKAPAQQFPRELVGLTRNKLSQARPPGAQRDVVRFNNLAELLAYLLADLAGGRAAQCWYWQRWSVLFALTPSAALRYLLSENLLNLPAISAQLHQLNRLDEVWLQLSDSDAGQLINEFSWKWGIQLPTSIADIEGTDSSTIPSLSNSLLQPLLLRWQPLLKQTALESPRYLLALLVVAQEAAPLVLQNAPLPLMLYLHTQRSHLIPEIKIKKQRSKFITQKDSDVAARAIAPNMSREKSTDVAHDTALARASLIEDEVSPAQHNVLSQEDVAEESTRQAGKRSDQPRHAVVESATAQSSTKHMHDGVNDEADLNAMMLNDYDDTIGDEAHVDQHTLPLDEAAQATFDTQQGGLFYCLNFLNRSECQAIMSEHWQLLPYGWGWLYRLGQTLQLDTYDTVSDFIALQLGFENRQALEQLAALPAADELNRLAQRWYAKTEVWNSTLLPLDATIEWSASHVDIHIAIENVQLPVRLAGLDINPGWLPWIGKVVSFHYDS